MFCEKCGQQLNEGAKFCSNCGTPTGDAVQTQEVQPIQEVQPVQQMPHYQKKINGVTINVAEVVIKTGFFDDGTPEEKAQAEQRAIEAVKTLTGAGMIKATFNVGNWKYDDELKKIILAFKTGITIEQPQDDGELRCPKCGSVHIEFNKKGFSGGKAIVGGVLAGPLGIAAGFMGKNKLKGKCLKCGHEWKI